MSWQKYATIFFFLRKTSANFVRNYISKMGPRSVYTALEFCLRHIMNENHPKICIDGLEFQAKHPYGFPRFANFSERQLVYKTRLQ